MRSDHLQKYAYSHHQDILGVITGEIKNTNAILQDISVPSELFSPKVNLAYKRLASYQNETEEIVLSIDLHLQRINELEQNPALQKISQLETEIKNNKSPLLLNSLNRELLHLRSIHANKLSALIALQQSVILKRSTLVQNWKSALSDEVMILEESKRILIDKIINMAHDSEDSETIQMVHDRIKELTGNEIDSRINKHKSSSVNIANIHILRKSLLDQLDEVEHIDKVIANKRQVIKALNKIIAEMAQKNPNIKATKAEIKEQPAVIEQPLIDEYPENTEQPEIKEQPKINFKVIEEDPFPEEFEESIKFNSPRMVTRGRGRRR